MVDWFGVVLKSVYYYSHLIGLSNFEVDWKTGRAYTTRRSSLYALFVLVMFSIFLAFQWSGQTQFNVIFGKANKLHEYVMVLMSGLRIFAGLSTLLIRWKRRCRVMKLTRSFFRIFQERPEVSRMCHRAILTKIFINVVTEGIQVWISLDALGSNPDTEMLFGQFLVYSMSAVLNLAVSQHYLFMLVIRARYQLLNRELRELIDESRELSHRPPRRGVFICRCCCLADRLEEIASVQGELQSLLVKVCELFAIQGLLVWSGYYLSTVGTGYFTYTMIKIGLKDLGITFTRSALIVTWCVFYYMDALLNLFVMLHVQEEHRETVNLMQERTLFALGLDVRLEEAFESLQLQLVRNPLQLNVLKMFPISRSATTAMVSSIVSNCLFLIQYDMEYY